MRGKINGNIKQRRSNRVLIMIVLLCLPVLSACTYAAREKAYYSQKDNFINVTGTVIHMQYSDKKDTLYLGFSDLNPKCDDINFKIVGDNLPIVQGKGIDGKITIGSEIEFMTAPEYFGDGYVMPIVAIWVDGEELLSFEEGYDNFMKWFEKK